MKKGSSKFRKLTDKQKAELSALEALPDDQIDTSDIPEVRDWSGAKRGVFFRPVNQKITLMLDADVVDWFKEQAPDERDCQTKINRALREYVMQRRR